MTANSRNSLSNQLFALLCSAGILLPALVAADFIHRYGFNALVFDDFEYVSTMGDVLQGRFPVAEWLKPHNDHRAFFGKTVMLGFGFLTQFNSVAEMYLSWFFKILTLVFVALITIRTVGRNKLALVLCVADSLLLFSLRNDQTFLFGVLFMVSMAVCSFVTSIYFLERAVQTNGTRSLLWCVLAAVSGIISTFSASINTIVIWPVGVLVLAYSAAATKTGLSRRILLYDLGLWTAFSIAALTAHFWGYDTSEWYKASAVANATRLKYGTLVMGGTLFGDPDTAFASGIILFVLSACALVAAMYRGLKFRLDLRTLPSVGLLLFGLASVLMVTFGRAGRFEMLLALAGRYAQFGAVGICGLLALLATPSAGPSRFRHIVMGMLLGLVLLGYVQSLRRSEVEGRTMLDQRKIVACRLRTYEIQSAEALASIGWGFDVTYRLAQIMEARHYNVFSEKQERTDGVPHTPLTHGFYIEKFALKPVSQAVAPIGLASPQSRAESTIEVSGWASDPEHKAPATAVFLKVGNYGEVPACYGLYRKDVASVLGNKLLKDSGFAADFSSRVLSPGTYPLSLLILGADRTKVFESPQFATLTISPSYAISLE